jgi:hypothetical protein
MASGEAQVTIRAGRPVALAFCAIRRSPFATRYLFATRCEASNG